MTLNNCDVLGTAWCIVDYFLLCLSALFLFLTLILYAILYRASNIPNRSRDFVFLGQSLQTLAMCLHYAFIGDAYDIIFLLQEYFLLIQYSMVFYYFLIQLAENLERLRKVKMPLLLLNCFMMIGFLIYVGSAVGLGLPLYNCNNIVWVYLHSCGLVLSAVFVLLGYHANKALQVLKFNENVMIDTDKLKHFWVIIISMCVASVVNIAESIFFIGINNDSCYDSYASNPDLDIAIFVGIRLLSHYLFVCSCLYIFRAEKSIKRYSEINTESERSFRNDLEGNSAENSWNYSMQTGNYRVSRRE